MWFKNLQVYQFIEDFDFDVSHLEACLREFAFKPCASILPMSNGWEAPIGKSDDAPLIHAANGLYLFCLHIEEKILPTTVVRDQLQERLDDIQQEQGRKLSSKEKLALKEDIYADLLPRAFSKNSRIYAMIDPKNELLIIDIGSRGKAEDFISLLRKTLGSLPVQLIETANPTTIMTNWLKKQKTPRNFEFAESCTLYDPKLEGSIVRCNKHDLLNPNIQAFINDGMLVNQIQLQWKDHMQFTLREDFSVTGIKYTDAVQELAADIQTETAEQQLDASFFIMSQTINEFLQEMLHIFRKN